MNSFTVLFVAALILGLAVELWLMRRQAVAVLAHRERVPEAFSTNIPLAAHHKAADYTVAKLRLGVVELLAGTLLLTVWTLGGGLNFLDQLWRAAGLLALGRNLSMRLLGERVMDLPWLYEKY